MTKCKRCTGTDGAHYAFCFLAQAWERFMGPGYPWAPTPEPTVVEPDWSSDWTSWVPLGEEPVDEDHGFVADDLPAFREPPPADPGVMEDFLVGSGAIPAPPWGMPHAEAKTELPEGYYDHLTKVDGYYEPDADDKRAFTDDDSPSEPVEEKPKGLRGSNNPKIRAAMEAAAKRRREEREDAVVQFAYDCLEMVPGGRVTLRAVHAKYVEWAEAGGKPKIAMDGLRALLDQVGLPVIAEKQTEFSTSGRPPLMVTGAHLKGVGGVAPTTKAKAKAEPEAPVTVKVRQHPLVGERPGREIDRDWAKLIEPLITEQGWAYYPHNKSGRGKPRIISPEGKMVTLASTPGDFRAMANCKATLRQNGAKL